MTDPLTFPIKEQSTGRYTATIVGNDGVTPLPGATLSTLTITLYVLPPDGTPAIVNGRNRQDALNAHDVTVSAGGRLVWLVQIGDTALVEALPFERHIALFEWTWPGGSGKHEVVLVVQNLAVVA
jgi:hypothetical protein